MMARKPPTSRSTIAGRDASRPKSTVMPTAMKKRPSRRALERFDVRLERVAVLRTGEQDAREERPECHRQPAAVMSCAMHRTSRSANAVKSSRMPVRATSRIAGRVK